MRRTMKTTNEVLKEIIAKLKESANDAYMYDDFSAGQASGYESAAYLVEEYLDKGAE